MLLDDCMTVLETSCIILREYVETAKAVFRRGRIRRRFLPQSFNTSRKIRNFSNFTRRNSSYPGSLGVLRDIFCHILGLV